MNDLKLIADFSIPEVYEPRFIMTANNSDAEARVVMTTEEEGWRDIAPHNCKVILALRDNDDIDLTDMVDAIDATASPRSGSVRMMVKAGIPDSIKPFVDLALAQ